MNAFISNILRYFPRVRESSGGGSRGGARPHPLIFRPKWGPKSRKKFLGDGPSPISGSGWPLSPPFTPLSEGLDPPLSRTVLDFGLHARFCIPGTGFQSLSVELGFWIPIVCGIPDFFELYWYSGFQSPGFQIPRLFQVLDSTSKNFLDSGIRIPLHNGAK